MSAPAPRLTSSPWSTQSPGLFTRDHYLTVPLDREGGETWNGESTITVYAREVVARQAGQSEPAELPALVYLQGGPGCESPRPFSDGGTGWLGVAMEGYRLFLLDQRGTGASTAVDRPDAAGSAEATANLLRHFRADAIVEDCEDLRRALGIERWSLLGQSFGGFCAIRYASAHPESLERIYTTGGIPAVGHSIDEVYRLTYELMQAKSEEHYARYPGDREAMARLAERSQAGTLTGATGAKVGLARLRSLGSLLGASSGSDTLHFLLERDPDSWAFRYDLESSLAFGGRFPLYAVIHESCWAAGGATSWAAERVLPAAFQDDPTLLTGEHLSRAFFEEDPTLIPWREVAEHFAEFEWPALYDVESLRTGGVRGAGVVYARDVYVPMVTSLETASLMSGMKTWVTSEYEHNGVRASGGEVIRRLRALADGVAIR